MKYFENQGFDFINQCPGWKCGYNIIKKEVGLACETCLKRMALNEG